MLARRERDGKLALGAAVGGDLRPVAAGQALQALQEDYARVVEDGLLFDDAEPPKALMARCTDVAKRTNREGT